MYRAIVEVTIKLVLDIDTDEIEPIMMEEGTEYELVDKIEAGINQFYEDTKYSFSDTENVTVVEKYSQLRNIERI